MRSFFKRLLKLDAPITVGDWFYNRVVNNWLGIVSIASGLGMSYLARISEWLRPWGPVGWGAVGLLSAATIGLFACIISFIFSQSYKKRVEARALADWSLKPNTVNPMETEFRNQRINLADLANPITQMITKKRFIGCELVGPITIGLSGGGGFRSCKFPNNNLIPIKCPFPIFGVYAISDCDFIECTFFAVTFLIPMPVLVEMEKGFVDGVLVYGSLTGDPKIDARLHPAFRARK